MLGRGNKAYQYYKKLLPNSVDSDIYQVEPYVYSQYITSDEHPTSGMASHSWQTGTAVWMYRVVIDYIFGVRTTYKGLKIDPVIPSSWKKFKVERVFRNTRYIIQFSNPNGIENGVKEIIVDGKKLESYLLHISDKTICSVKVVMGKRKSV